jgi:hypothetical protein
MNQATVVIYHNNRVKKWFPIPVLSPTYRQEMTRLNIGIFIANSDPPTLKKRKILRFFFSTRKICPILNAGQDSKSKTEIKLKTDLQCLV